jgi:hypothetical protein
MSAILGSAGSNIAEDLSLDIIPEFVFKDDMESCNFLTILEKHSLAWQPSAISAVRTHPSRFGMIIARFKDFMIAFIVYYFQF